MVGRYGVEHAKVEAFKQGFLLVEEEDENRSRNEMTFVTYEDSTIPRRISLEYLQLEDRRASSITHSTVGKQSFTYNQKHLRHKISVTLQEACWVNLNGVRAVRRAKGKSLICESSNSTLAYLSSWSGYLMHCMRALMCRPLCSK
ncbi:hypothetical protein J6590_012251 [Homalodisca vitripennis]|nr:hypothetical protein J6590_012251 [Homalodisca vitripennis]